VASYRQSKSRRYRPPNPRRLHNRNILRFIHPRIRHTIPEPQLPTTTPPPKLITLRVTTKEDLNHFQLTNTILLLAVERECPFLPMLVSVFMFPTRMFALPNPMSHVSSVAFAQARLRPGSPSAQVCPGLLTPITRRSLAKNNLTSNHQLLTRGLFRPLPSQGSQICYHLYYADR
jgi:hypothetical protein